MIYKQNVITVELEYRSRDSIRDFKNISEVLLCQ